MDDDGAAIVGCSTSGGLTMGLGFNYGSFNLDMSVTNYDAMLNNPVHYIAGRNATAVGGNWTISYNW